MGRLDGMGHMCGCALRQCYVYHLMYHSSRHIYIHVGHRRSEIYIIDHVLVLMHITTSHTGHGRNHLPLPTINVPQWEGSNLR